MCSEEKSPETDMSYVLPAMSYKPSVLSVDPCTGNVLAVAQGVGLRYGFMLSNTSLPLRVIPRTRDQMLATFTSR
jgi:hypothetical protein